MDFFVVKGWERYRLTGTEEANYMKANRWFLSLSFQFVVFFIMGFNELSFWVLRATDNEE